MAARSGMPESTILQIKPEKGLLSMKFLAPLKLFNSPLVGKQGGNNVTEHLRQQWKLSLPFYNFS